MNVFASTNKKEPLLLYNPNNPLNTASTTKKTRPSPNKITSHIHNHRQQSQQYNIKLTNTDNLKPHEHTDPKKIREVKKSIIEQGIKYPIVADKKTNIILDGHHRHNVFKKLKIKNIPVFYVNYMDERIILNSWNNHKLTKQDVINNATSHKLYPIKTTKHMLKTPDGQTHISQTLPRINLDITQLKKR